MITATDVMGFGGLMVLAFSFALVVTFGLLRGIFRLMFATLRCKRDVSVSAALRRQPIRLTEPASVIAVPRQRSVDTVESALCRQSAGSSQILDAEDTAWKALWT